MRKRALTEYGKKVKHRLVDIDKTQEWLVAEIKKALPDCYVDGSLVNKILVGDVVDSKVVPVINKILEITE